MVKRFTFCTVVLSVMAIVGAPSSGEDKADPHLRLELDLVDGSHVIGVPKIVSVPLQTSYAKMDIPLKQILTLRIDANHETASLDLQNGDRLKGVVNLEPIGLETVFGKVAVGIEHIRELRVTPGGGGLPGALRQGLVLYYPFDRDEGGKVSDASGKGHDGTATGAAWTSKGKVGGAYGFAGETHVDTGFPFGAGMDEFSASLWMLDTKGKGNGVVAGIDFTASHQDKDYVWSIYYDPSRFLWARVRHPDGSWRTTYGTIFPVDEWQHLVVTFKRNDSMKFYQNGVLVGRQATADAGTMGGTTYSAGLAGTPGSSYDGCILDEVLFYSRALSADEVMTLYLAK